MVKTTTKNRTYYLSVTALMAAVTCILGPLSIPIGPIPISLTNLAVYFTAYLLGSRMASLSYLLYLLIGLIGLPVFSGFGSGPGQLFGPTGGYLIGFLFTALISGWFIEHFPARIFLHVLGMILGTAVLYLFGTCWLAHQAGLNFQAAFAAGVLPFFTGDAGKIALAALTGPVIRRALMKSGL